LENDVGSVLLRNREDEGDQRVRLATRKGGRAIGGGGGTGCRRNRAESAADTAGSGEGFRRFGEEFAREKKGGKKRGSRGFYSRPVLGRGLGFRRGNR
jgi:hypothetical protein